MGNETPGVSSETTEKSKRQAVVIIHGIGEQRPMETLTNFIDAVWRTDKQQTEMYEPKVYSKPDHVSENFELRRLTTNKNKNNYVTEFYEYYWAHMMDGNQLHHLWTWSKKLLLGKLPPVLNLVRWVLLILLSITLALVFYLFNSDIHLPFHILKIGGLMLTFILIPWVTSILTDIAGDAARYIDASPRNVKARQEIRKSGVALIKSLHDSGKFDRIILVGHSLGSMIAYDILTFSFPLIQGEFPKGKHLPAAKAVAEYTLSGITDVQHFQNLQAEAFREQKNLNHGWLVSDFITLGSPLTYADVLWSGDKKLHHRRVEEKVLPVCPPVLENDGFIYSHDARKYHHAAHFAMTRWTNIYFPQKLLIFGDLISGPLQSVFGKGVRDIKSWYHGKLGLFSHTKYWKPSKNNRHLVELRNAINLLDL